MVNEFFKVAQVLKSCKVHITCREQDVDIIREWRRVEFSWKWHFGKCDATTVLRNNNTDATKRPSSTNYMRGGMQSIRKTIQ